MSAGSGSFARLATVTASTKRMEAVVDGLSGDLATQVPLLKCLPLDPLSPEVARMAGLDTFAELLQTMCEGGLDILEGDVLYVDSNSYNIRAVGQWNWSPTGANTLRLILQEAK